MIYHNPRKSKWTIQVKKWPFDPVIDGWPGQIRPGQARDVSLVVLFTACTHVEIERF